MNSHRLKLSSIDSNRNKQLLPKTDNFNRPNPKIKHLLWTINFSQENGQLSGKMDRVQHVL